SHAACARLYAARTDQRGGRGPCRIADHVPAYTRPMSCRFRATAIAVLAAVLSGCATYQPIETTPEGIAGNVSPGDSVRAITRDENEVRFLVTAIDDAEVR